MSMIGFPLLLIPLAIYNIFVFLMPGVAFTSQITRVTLMSGVAWTPTFGDALIALAIVMLLFEIIKASRPGARYLTDHLLSLIVFAGAAAEFLFLKALGTSDFFLLTVLTGVEFMAGAAIGLRNRRYSTTMYASEPAPQDQAQEPAIQEPERHEPTRWGRAMFSRKPDRSAPTEPSRAEIFPPEAKPPEMISVSPAPAPPAVAAPKPIPAPVADELPVAEQPVAEQPVAERKLSDWSMSDLISDRDQKAKSDSPAQSDKPDERKS